MLKEKEVSRVLLSVPTCALFLPGFGQLLYSSKPGASRGKVMALDLTTLSSFPQAYRSQRLLVSEASLSLVCSLILYTPLRKTALI